MSREVFEKKYGQSWADTPPRVRELWLEAWQSATAAQEARVRELRGQLENCINHLHRAHRRLHDKSFSEAIEAANRALSATETRT